MSKKQKNIKASKKKRQPKKVNEIRTDYSAGPTGHPAYIYRREGSKFHFVGITHAPITDRTRNIRLSKNPDPGASEPSYARPFKEVKHKKNFGVKHKSWKLSKKDKNKLKKLPKKK